MAGRGQDAGRRAGPSQGDRSARGRTSRIVEDPLGEQLALEEAERQATQLEAAYAELRAASTRLEEVTLSAEALAVLYDLLRRAMGQLDQAEGTGEFAHARSRLRVRLRFHPGARARVRAETGTLTLGDIGIDMLVLLHPGKRGSEPHESGPAD